MFIPSFIMNRSGYAVLPAALFFVMAFLSCKEKKDEARIVSGDVKDIRFLNEQITRFPHSPFLYNDRAKLYVADRRFSDALSDVEKAISLDSTQSDFFVTKADALFPTRKVKGAIEALEKAISLDEKNLDARLKLAELYLYVEDRAKAIIHADEVLRRDIHNARAYFIKGVSFKELGDTAKAVSSFQTVVEQDPGHFKAFMQLGLILSARHDKLAAQYLTTALRIQPHSVEALYARAMFFQEHGDPERALHDYSTILRIDPDYKHAHYNSGYIKLVLLHNFKEAARHFTDAIQRDSEFTNAYYNRGLAYEEMKEREKARADFEKALSLQPDHELAGKALKNLK